MLPLYLWFWTGEPLFASPYLVAPWVAFVALLMVSSVATLSWTSFRLRRHVRFEALAIIVVVGVALISAPWHALTALCLVYLASIPFTMLAYAKLKRPRGAATVAKGQASPPPSA
jgi:CDP-diacylglycerol--serine O-phosphatidyltransferase